MVTLPAFTIGTLFTQQVHQPLHFSLQISGNEGKSKIANLCREHQSRQNLKSFSEDRKFVVLRRQTKVRFIHSNKIILLSTHRLSPPCRIPCIWHCYKFLVFWEENLKSGPNRKFFEHKSEVVVKNNVAKASNWKPLLRMNMRLCENFSRFQVFVESLVCFVMLWDEEKCVPSCTLWGHKNASGSRFKVSLWHWELGEVSNWRHHRSCINLALIFTGKKLEDWFLATHGYCSMWGLILSFLLNRPEICRLQISVLLHKGFPKHIFSCSFSGISVPDESFWSLAFNAVGKTCWNLQRMKARATKTLVRSIFWKKLEPGALFVHKNGNL